ncbi:MAG TPA: 50S ribosomal protein L21 [Chloroflexia bacterium]|nr:50S ribosomal protein L21 [Chloroflexia bacterium]
MYAIVRTGGHQYKVAVGDQLNVEKLDVAAGEQVELTEVLMVGGEDTVQVGNPLVPGARVIARVVDQHRGPKIIVFKFKAKKRYRRKMGHRQSLTRLAITEITV